MKIKKHHHKFNFKKCLKDVSTVSGLLLIPIFILYFLTGYSITGKIHVFPAKKAIRLHDHLDTFAIPLLILHVSIELYFLGLKYYYKYKAKPK